MPKAGRLHQQRDLKIWMPDQFAGAKSMTKLPTLEPLHLIKFIPSDGRRGTPEAYKFGVGFVLLSTITHPLNYRKMGIR